MELEDLVTSRPLEGALGTDLVLMLHGYGSDTSAVTPLFEVLPPNATGVAVRGPFEMDDEQYGWFLLDWGLRPDLSRVIEAAASVLALQDRLAATFRSVSVLGHSQGMAMATTLLRLRPQAYRCAVGLSGFVVDQPLLDLGNEQAPRVPFFWGRDPDEFVINPEAQARAAEWLKEHTALTARRYEGMGHRIGEDEIRDVGAFLRHYLPV
ncbi:MAG: phospholipase [Arthrobacter sp.]|nr:phospholipase [Arthrobacter sp.]